MAIPVALTVTKRVARPAIFARRIGLFDPFLCSLRKVSRDIPLASLRITIGFSAPERRIRLCLPWRRCGGVARRGWRSTGCRRFFDSTTSRRVGVFVCGTAFDGPRLRLWDFWLHDLGAGVGVAFDKYRVDEVRIERHGLMTGSTKVQWPSIVSASVRPLATGRSLPRAVLLSVVALLYALWGLVLEVWVLLANGSAPGERALALSGPLVLLGFLFGRRAIVTCWQFGRYALIIDVVGQPKPVKIRPSHCRLVIEAKARDINTMVGRASGAPFAGQFTINVHGSQGTVIGNGNTQHNDFQKEPPGPYQA